MAANGKQLPGRQADSAVIARQMAIEARLLDGEFRPHKLAKEFGVAYQTIFSDMKSIQSRFAVRQEDLESRRGLRIAQLQRAAVQAMLDYQEGTVDDKGNHRKDSTLLRLFKDCITEAAKLEGLYVTKSQVDVRGRIDVLTLALEAGTIPDDVLDGIVRAAEEFERHSGQSLLAESETEKD